jgi:hypothetical protein
VWACGHVVVVCSLISQSVSKKMVELDVYAY